MLGASQAMDEYVWEVLSSPRIEKEEDPETRWAHPPVQTDGSAGTLKKVKICKRSFFTFQKRHKMDQQQGAIQV